MMQGLKCTIVVALLFSFCGTLQAQQWEYGVNVDLNYSYMNGKGMSSKMNLGYAGGVWANYAITKKLRFQPELSGAQYNYTKAGDFDKYYKNDVGRVDADTKVRLAYFNVPLLLRYDIFPMFSVLAGPQAGIVFFEDENLRKDGINAFRRPELSATGGFQFNFGSASIYGRFNQGLSNISNMGTKYNWYSGHIQFGLAVKIK